MRFSNRSRYISIFQCLAVFLSLCFQVSAAGQTVVVEADSPLIQYTGRVDLSDTKSPYVTWPGSIIRANFTGQSLSIVLDDDRGDNFFNVFIDGSRDYPFVIDTEAGEKVYRVGFSLAPGNHSVEIYKRTEGAEGGTHFKGLILDEGAKLLSPPERPSRRIEFFGDSITSGMGNEGADTGADHLASEKNQYLSYSGFVARNLDAEAHVISKSGIGIMISWFDFIMPQYYDQLSAIEDNDSSWDFSQWTPDVVVINLYQNDCWLVDREKRLDPMPSEEDRVQAYMDFLNTIRNIYPKDTYFVCALGSMDATEGGSAWPGYIEQAVEHVKASEPHARIDTLFFEFTGYGKHPRVKQHKDNAQKLSELIAQNMGWEL